MPVQVNLMQEGLDRLQAGDHTGAAQTFVCLLRQDPHSEEAWLSLAECLTSPRQKRDCLDRVLRLNPWHGEARAALSALEETRPSPGILFNEAKLAEDRFDYSIAYQLYSHAAKLAPASLPTWLGKGFCAGMLSTPEQNRVREFFDCLSHALEQIPVTGVGGNGTGPKPSPQQAAAQLEPALAARLTHQLRYLADYVTVLSERCSPDMANIYAVERVHLADWAFYVASQPGLQDSPTYTREQMLFIAGDAFRGITARINQHTRGPRARHELLQTFKLFLLSNLSLSGLNKDVGLLERLAKLEAG